MRIESWEMINSNWISRVMNCFQTIQFRNWIYSPEKGCINDLREANVRRLSRILSHLTLVIAFASNFPIFAVLSIFRATFIFFFYARRARNIATPPTRRFARRLDEFFFFFSFFIRPNNKIERWPILSLIRVSHTRVCTVLEEYEEFSPSKFRERRKLNSRV